MDRFRADRCPGALRPWPAADGLLVRLRLPGGRIRSSQLLALAEVAERYGDGRVHVTSRTNLQVRALPAVPGTEELPEEVLLALEETGLLPSRTHDLARNVMASPQTGLAGGRADLRPVISALDHALCADRLLANLPGRFLFVLDDGRGDLLARPCDLGLVALTADTAQLRIGDGWGDVVQLGEAHESVATLARAFLLARGDGPGAAWHVHELAEPLTGVRAPAPDLPTPAHAPPYGVIPGGFHEAVADSGLSRTAVERLCATTPELVVTPWRGVLIPEENP